MGETNISCFWVSAVHFFERLGMLRCTVKNSKKQNVSASGGQKWADRLLFLPSPILAKKLQRNYTHPMSALHFE
jgi:hypothetical protein